MARQFHWTNESVVAFAGQKDPVEVMEGKARTLALNAMDAGWDGPPFDPLALAQWLGIPIEARGDIPDARMVPMPDGVLILEYKPMRPRGRLRFSIAHEIAHSQFSDCAAEVRNRGKTTTQAPDNWQLEVLCNIGAAELLMPLGCWRLRFESAPTRKKSSVAIGYSSRTSGNRTQFDSFLRVPTIGNHPNR